MKYTLKYILLIIVSGCIYNTKGPISESTVRAIVERKYDSLRVLLKDSLSKGIINVNDYDNNFKEFEKNFLDSLIDDFKRKSGIQIALFTYDSLMTAVDSVEETTRIIGVKFQINTTIGISFPNKTMSIWNDSLVNNSIFAAHEAKYMINDKFLPYFKNGEYFKGTAEGVKAVIQWMTNRRRAFPIN